jgi:hypothetical protein
VVNKIPIFDIDIDIWGENIDIDIDILISGIVGD